MPANVRVCPRALALGRPASAPRAEADDARACGALRSLSVASPPMENVSVVNHPPPVWLTWRRSSS